MKRQPNETKQAKKRLKLEIADNVDSNLREREKMTLTVKISGGIK